MPRRIGQLDRQIVLQSRYEARDAMGQPVQTWSTVATIWARMEDAAGNTRLAGNEIVAGVERVYTMHYVTGVDTRHRILDGGVAWDIVRVVEEQRERGLVVYVRSPGNEDQT